jgi:transcriptional regulator of arginine metabolism
MQKRDRQQKLADIVQSKKIASQHELIDALTAAGVFSNQATVSRDLNELGISKIKGIYRLPQIEPGESNLIDLFNLDVAGDYLIVMKTSPGKASMAAAAIDNLKLDEVVGTLAGDDTIFIAVKGRAEQSKAIKHILHHFRRH